MTVRLLLYCLLFCAYVSCIFADTYKPFAMSTEDIYAVLNNTLVHRLPTISKLPADITFGCADIKYNPKNGESVLKFCECGDGIYMSFRTASVELNNHIQDVVSPYWGIFWNYIKSFGLPFWLVENCDYQNALALQECKRLGGHYVSSLNDLERNPVFKRSKCAAPTNKADIKSYKGIIVFRANTEKAREGETFCKFKKRNPEFLYVNAMARHYFKRKDNTYALFANAGLSKYIPQFVTMSAEYNNTLAHRILGSVASNPLIVKPAFSSLSMGVNTVERQDLDALLKLLLKDYRKIDSDAHRCFLYWRQARPRQMVAAEYVPSKTIYKDGKPYDPTMRVVFMMHHDGDTVSINVIAGFWKIPVKSLIDDVPLTEKTITIAHAGAYYSGIFVDRNDWNDIKSILHSILPELYITMLKQGIPNHSSPK